MSWPNVALNEIAKINPKGPSKNELSPDELVDFVPMAFVSETGRMQPDGQRPYAEVSKGYTAFKDKDVLLAKITPCFENNKIAQASVATPYAFGSTEFHVIRRDVECLDEGYLTHFLRQDRIRKAGERRMTGSGGQRRVPKAFLENLKIPLPPLEEQKRIAGILDQADALRRLRTRALDTLNTLGQAIFHEMFGDIEKAFEWPTTEIGNLTEHAQIGAVRGAKDMGDDKPVDYLRMDAIGNDGSLSLNGLRRVEASQSDLKKYSLLTGDFLLNTRNSKELVGKSAVFRGRFSGIYNNNILRCRFNDPKFGFFLDAYLRTRAGKSQLSNIKSGTTSVFAIYQKAFMGLPVPVPPKDLTEGYSQRLGRLSECKKHYEALLTKQETLFASLQHRAFRGEL